MGGSRASCPDHRAEDAEFCLEVNNLQIRAPPYPHIRQRPPVRQPPFQRILLRACIDHRFISIAHPQTNGETEITNRTILQGLKARLDKSKGQWVEDLYNVLWAYRTTFRVPTGETLFNLTYGMEAVIPLEIGLPSPRVEHHDASSNSSQLRNNLDLIEEIREAARVRMARYQQKTAQYYNARVKVKSFKAGDLVLRRAEASRPTEQGKLAPN